MAAPSVGGRSPAGVEPPVLATVPRIETAGGCVGHRRDARPHVCRCWAPAPCRDQLPEVGEYEATMGCRSGPSTCHRIPLVSLEAARRSADTPQVRADRTSWSDVLIGEAGTGKHDGPRRTATGQGSGVAATSAIVQLSNPTLTRAEFYEYLAAGYGFSAAAQRPSRRFLRARGGAPARSDRSVSPWWSTKRKAPTICWKRFDC